MQQLQWVKVLLIVLREALQQQQQLNASINETVILIETAAIGGGGDVHPLHQVPLVVPLLTLVMRIGGIRLKRTVLWLQVVLITGIIITHYWASAASLSTVSVRMKSEGITQAGAAATSSSSTGNAIPKLVISTTYLITSSCGLLGCPWYSTKVATTSF